MIGWRHGVLGLLAGGLVLLAAGCGGPSRAERAMAEKDGMIRRYEQDKATAEQREKALLEQQRALEEQQALALKQNQFQAEQLGDISKRNAQLAASNAQHAASTEAKVDALSAQIAELKSKLNAKPGGEVEVVRADKIGAITIRVANTVLFDPGKADLKSSAHSTLDKVAETLKKQYGTHFVRVEGHTDSTPVVHNKAKYADNMALSQARAKAVFDYLVSHARMPANRMYCAGYANSQPVVWPEKTVTDRAKNRRVDIVILPNVKVEKEALTASK